MARPALVLVSLISYIILIISINSCYAQYHKALFVFGDSLFDPGNNQYLNDSRLARATTWPYGETYFKHPTGRLCDGRTVPDIIAQYAKLPILPPYLQPGAENRFTDGANFASAGAGVLAGTHPGIISLPLQIGYFKEVKKSLKQKLGAAQAEKLLNGAVYLFSIGGNDYFSYSTSNPKSPQSIRNAYVKTVIGNLTSALKEVYSLGGRKIAFQNAGPLGCIPATKSTNPEIGNTCADQPSALARLHNRYLSVVLKKMATQLPGFKHAIFDYYNALGDRVIHPSKYGFKDGMAACCGSGAYRADATCGGGLNKTAKFELCSDPKEYVWFDGAHTTEATNFQLANILWSGAPPLTGPYNIRQLFEVA